MSQSQQGPRVRSACEACHSRKQRCILPEAGGACQACVQNSRQCYFVPRYRPGRPQRRQTDDRGNGSSRSSNTSSNGSSGRGASSPVSISPLLNPDVLVDSYVDQNGDLSTLCPKLGLSKSGLEVAVTELGEFPDGTQGSWDTGSAFNFNLDGTEMVNPFQLLPISVSPREQCVGEAYHSHREPASDATPGAELARQFIHLESQREALLPSDAKPMDCEEFCTKIEPCLDTISKICPQAMMLVGKFSKTRDASLGAIMTATLVKVFDLCETVLSLVEGQLGSYQQHSPSTAFDARLVDGTTRPSVRGRTFSSTGQNSAAMGVWSNQSSPLADTSNAEAVVRFVLTLKQLELHLGQAKICMSLLALNKAAHAGFPFLERSAGLHARINTAIEAVCV